MERVEEVEPGELEETPEEVEEVEEVAETTQAPWEELEQGPDDKSWIPARARKWLAERRPLSWTISAPGCAPSGPFEVRGTWTVEILKRWLERYQERWEPLGPVRIRIRGDRHGKRGDLDSIDVMVPTPAPPQSMMERLAQQFMENPEKLGASVRVFVAEASPVFKSALGMGVGELMDVFAEASAQKVVDRLKEE